MRPRGWILAYTAAGLLAAAAPAAAANDLLARGKITFGLPTGGLRIYEDGGFFFTLAPSAGVFVVKGLWLGGELGLGYIGGSDYGGNIVKVSGGPDYCFDVGPRWSPYVGVWGRIGTGSDWGVNGRLGAKVFVVPRTALDIGYRALADFDEDYYGDEATVFHELSFGFQVFF